MPLEGHYKNAVFCLEDGDRTFLRNVYLYQTGMMSHSTCSFSHGHYRTTPCPANAETCTHCPKSFSTTPLSSMILMFDYSRIPDANQFSFLCHIHRFTVIITLRGPRWLIRYSDSLRTGRSGDRIPVGARLPAPVQTGPRAHPASCTMGTGLFPGLKRPGREVDHSPQSSVKIKEWICDLLPLCVFMGWTGTALSLLLFK
jgi:hypothetical protein